METKVLSKITDSELTHLLYDMVRIPSVNPELLTGEEKDETQIIDFLDRKFREYNFETELQKVEKNRYNVIARVRGCGEKIVALNGHIDTVSGFNMPHAFNPKIEKGKLYGRGSCDMKGGIAAMITAAKAVKDSGIKLKGDIVIAIVVDEEQWGKGTQTYLKNEKPNYCIIAEPTQNKICLSQSGYIELDLITTGKIKHGMTVKLDDTASAFVNAVKLLNRFLESKIIRKKHIHMGIELSNTINFSLKDREIPAFMRRIALPSSYAWMSSNYCKVNVLIGVAPFKTKKQSDRKAEKIIDELENIVIHTGDEDVKSMLEILCANNGFIQQKNKFVEKFSKAIYEVNGSIEYGHMPSFCDGTFFHNAGVSTILYGPGNIENAHSPDEYVNLKEVKESAYGIAQAVQYILN